MKHKTPFKALDIYKHVSAKYFHIYWYDFYVFKLFCVILLHWVPLCPNNVFFYCIGCIFFFTSNRIFICIRNVLIYMTSWLSVVFSTHLVYCFGGLMHVYYALFSVNGLYGFDNAFLCVFLQNFCFRRVLMLPLNSTTLSTWQVPWESSTLAWELKMAAATARALM